MMTMQRPPDVGDSLTYYECMLRGTLDLLESVCRSMEREGLRELLCSLRETTISLENTWALLAMYRGTLREVDHHS